MTNDILQHESMQDTLKSAWQSAEKSPHHAPEIIKPEPAAPNVASKMFAPPTVTCLPPPPIEVLPPVIQDLLLEAAKVFGDLPLEVPVVSFFGLLSGCLGQAVVIEVKRDWLVAGNFYWALVATSGLGKSPCANAMMRPLWLHDKKNKDKWEAEMAVYESAVEEKKKAKDVGEALSPKPILTQYIADDATIEAIGGILSENPRGLLWCCDELSMLMQNLDRYSNSKGGSKGRLLSSYDRSPWKTSRREREKDQLVMSAVLSIFGTIQPKILKSVFSQQDADSGLLPRFAFILARRSNPPMVNDDEFSGQQLLSEIVDHLLSWNLDNCDGDPIPNRVKLNSDAYTYFRNWSNTLSDNTWGISELDRLIVPKLTGMVLRLSLLIHCLDAALKKSDWQSEISLDTMSGATRFGDWIYQHQKHIWLSLGLAGDPIKTPLEEATVYVALGLSDYLEANQWRILNDDFNPLVCGWLGQEVPGNQVGRACNNLGIKSITIGKKRAKEFTPKLLEKFKASLYS